MAYNLENIRIDILYTCIENWNDFIEIGGCNSHEIAEFLQTKMPKESIEKIMHIFGLALRKIENEIENNNNYLDDNENMKNFKNIITDCIEMVELEWNIGDRMTNDKNWLKYTG